MIGRRRCRRWRSRWLEGALDQASTRTVLLLRARARVYQYWYGSLWDPRAATVRYVTRGWTRVGLWTAATRMFKRLVGLAPRLCEQRCLRAQAGLLARSVSTTPPSSTLEATLRKFGVQRVRPWLASALHRAGFVEPLPVQGAAMERVARHEDVVIHAETGTGKTLAYLVPVLSRLEPAVPLQLLILLPSRELALQVASEVHRLLAAPAPLHVALAVGGTDVAAGGVAGAGGSDEALTRASAQLQAQRALAEEVKAGRAQVLVGTPHAVRRVLHTGVRAERTHASDFDFSDSRGLTSQLSFGQRQIGGDDYFGTADYFGLQQGGTDSAKLLLTIAYALHSRISSP